jgi:hypothetical protein
MSSEESMRQSPEERTSEILADLRATRQPDRSNEARLKHMLRAIVSGWVKYIDPDVGDPERANLLHMLGGLIARAGLCCLDTTPEEAARIAHGPSPAKDSGLFDQFLEARQLNMNAAIEWQVKMDRAELFRFRASLNANPTEFASAGPTTGQLSVILRLAALGFDSAAIKGGIDFAVQPADVAPEPKPEVAPAGPMPGPEAIMVDEEKDSPYLYYCGRCRNRGNEDRDVDTIPDGVTGTECQYGPGIRIHRRKCRNCQLTSDQFILAEDLPQAP